MAKKVFIYHEIATDFLTRELATMPEQDANRIAAEILAFAADLLPKADWPRLIKDLIMCSQMPWIYNSTPGRPNKKNAPAPTIARLIAEPKHRTRIEAILRSEAIEKPANVAHLAIAIEELKWTEGSLNDFYRIAVELIGTRAGRYEGFRSAITRTRRDNAMGIKGSNNTKDVKRLKALLEQMKSNYTIHEPNK